MGGRRRGFHPGFVVFLVLGVIGAALLFVGDPAGERPGPPPRSGEPEPGGDPPAERADAPPPEGPRLHFVEIAYEQGFAPNPKAIVPRRSPAEELNAYFLSEDENVLYPCAPGFEPPPDGLLIGRRFHNRFKLHHHTWQELVAAPEGLHTWPVGTEPAAASIRLRGPTSWLRMPVTVSVTREGDACVLAAGGDPVRLEVGQTKRIWTDSRTFTLEEYVAASAAAAGLAEPPTQAEVERLGRRLPLDDNGSLTLHARVIAVHHGLVTAATFNPRDARDAGVRALRRGEFDEALAQFDAFLAVIPESTAVRDLRDRARAAEDQGIQLHRLQGALRLPDGEQANPARTWIGLRGPEDPEDESRDMARVEEGRFEFFVGTGPYVVTAYVPGFNPVSQAVSVPTETGVRIDVRESDRRPR